ncbi:hypothetical protein Leryth_009049 [Lithospermum erythrorhizon]|nr:hypothetical protein Leryth_009049 [Lithospermum erythrorhizon]
MGKLENGWSEMFMHLGLEDTMKSNPGNPRVLSLLSTVLERYVEANERLLETNHMKDVISIFHGSRPPSLGIQQYIDRIFKYACCSPSCFIVAHVYVERFMERNNVCLTSLSIHRLLITSIMVAAKFVDDAFFNNAYYARVGGVTTAELNKLEMEFLFGLDFRLHVSMETFHKYCSVVENEGLPIDRLIQACRVKETWPNKEDSAACPPTIAR